MKKWIFLAILLLELPVHAKPLRLVLNWKPEAEFGGFYSAQIEGVFKKHGLDVILIPGGAGTPSAQMVAADQAEFGIVSGEELVVAHARGSDILALFAVYQDSPVILMTHAEQNFKSIQDVFQSPGILSVQRGLPFFAYLEKKFGKPKAKIVPSQGGITQFLVNSNYSQQGFMTSEPILAAQKGVKTKSFLISNEGFNPYLTVLVARKDYVEKNIEKVKLLMTSVREGWKIYLDNPDKTNETMHKLNPSMSLQTLKESAEVQKAFIETKDVKKSNLGTMTVDRWQKLVEQLKTIGVIRQDIQANELFKNL